MKALFPALLLTCAAIPAQAQTVLPNLYAHEYCQLRSVGADRQSAIASAIRSATVSGNDWVYVNLGGQQQRSDIVRGAIAVRQLCPQYLQN